MRFASGRIGPAVAGFLGSVGLSIVVACGRTGLDEGPLGGGPADAGIEAGPETGTDAPSCTPGFLDPAFGRNGVSDPIIPVTPGSYRRAGVLAMSIDPETGSTVVTMSAGDRTTLRVIRLLAGGQLDPDYHADPIPMTSALDMATAPGGRVLVLGHGGKGGSLLARLEADGTLDEGYGENGVARLPACPVGVGAFTSVSVVGAGALVAGRCNKGVDLWQTDTRMARLREDGSLDTSFGDGGLVIESSSESEYPTGVFPLADGSIVVAGSIFTFGGPNVVLTRYTSSGERDVTFGTNGRALSQFGIVPPVPAVGQHGYYVASAYHPDDHGSIGGLIHMDAAGDRDMEFGENGVAPAPHGPAADPGEDVVVQPDERILFVMNPVVSEPCAVFRFLPDGTPDPSFGEGGKIVLPSIMSCKLGIQSDHRAIVVGMRTGLSGEAVAAGICL